MKQGVIKVLCSSEFVEHNLKTGNIIKHTEVTEGLPDDSKLIHVGLDNVGRLELVFSSAKLENNDEYINIEFTTLEK